MMDKCIKKLLEKLENDGYEAYIVGGYVRDYLLNKESFDIDICTNRKPSNLESLFNLKCSRYGNISFKLDKYNIDITSFRKELEYLKRKPIKLEYIDDLKSDLLRRDFTINAICMDKNGNIIDLLNGKKDLDNKIIKIIGDPKKKLEDDPLRILRAIRFSTTLLFDIDKDLDKEILENYELVKNLSPFRLRSEFEKILLSENYIYGLELLEKYNILSLLNIKYKNIVYVNNIYGMFAQLKTEQNFAFTKEEEKTIINIRQIIENGFVSDDNISKYDNESIKIAKEILEKYKRKE